MGTTWSSQCDPCYEDESEIDYIRMSWCYDDDTKGDEMNVTSHYRVVDDINDTMDVSEDCEISIDRTTKYDEKGGIDPTNGYDVTSRFKMLDDVKGDEAMYSTDSHSCRLINEWFNNQLWEGNVYYKDILPISSFVEDVALEIINPKPSYANVTKALVSPDYVMGDVFDTHSGTEAIGMAPLLQPNFQLLVIIEVPESIVSEPNIYESTRSIAEDSESVSRSAQIGSRTDYPGLLCNYVDNAVVQRELAVRNDCISKLRVIMDSGATSHMTPDATLLGQYENHTGRVVFGSKGSGDTNIIGRGNVWILNNVLHVPDLKMMIISESKLDSEGYSIIRKSGKCEVLHDDELIFTASRTKDNLYEIDPLYKSIMCNNTCYSCSMLLNTDTIPDDQLTTSLYKRRHKKVIFADNPPESNPDDSKESHYENMDEEVSGKRKLYNPATSEYDFTYGSHGKKGKKELGVISPLMILHRRFGHWNENQIKKLVRENLAVGIGYTIDDIKDDHIGMCPICLEAKMTANPPKRQNEINEYNPGEYWSFDIKKSP